MGAPGERTAATDLLAPDGDDLPTSADAADFAACHHQIGHNQGAAQQIIDDFGVTGVALYQGSRHADDTLTTSRSTIVAATADGVEGQKGGSALTALFEGGNGRLGIIPIAGDDVLQAGAEGGFDSQFDIAGRTNDTRHQRKRFIAPFGPFQGRLDPLYHAAMTALDLQ